MSNKVVSVVGCVAVSVMIAAGSAVAQERADVLERIKPIGQVTVGKAAPAAESAPVSAPEPMAAAAPAAATPAPAPAPAAESAPASTAAVGSGAELYASKGCALCHGEDANSPIMSTYPKVAGQPDVYTLNQLKDIKSGARNNGQSAMRKGIVAGLSDAEMAAIAKWLSSQ